MESGSWDGTKRLWDLTWHRLSSTCTRPTERYARPIELIHCAYHVPTRFPFAPPSLCVASLMVGSPAARATRDRRRNSRKEEVHTLQQQWALASSASPASPPLSMAKSTHAPVGLSGGGVAASNGAATAASSSAATAAAAQQSFWRRALLLVGCSLGIYATFLLYGILQERMSVDAQGPRRTQCARRARRRV